MQYAGLLQRAHALTRYTVHRAMQVSAALAECVPIGAMEFDKLVSFAKDNAIDFTIIGMDDPLVGGIVDEFEKAGHSLDQRGAAILEGSKAFSKDLMKKYNIPTAAYENFTDAKEALKYLETCMVKRQLL